MKFSGSGSEVFNRAYDAYIRSKNKEFVRRKRPTPKQIADAKKMAYDLVRNQEKPIFSPWEEKVRKKLRDSNIEFEVKFRKFPIYIDDNAFVNYVPDFILKHHEINAKQILIEAHEYLTERDAILYGLFMETYGGQYYLIMIVSDNQLRQWNELDQANRRLFNDIWSIDDLDFFIRDLQKYKHISSEDNRQSRIKPSYTRMQIVSELIRPKKPLFCVGCKQSFETYDVSQLYCFQCLDKYLR